MPCVELPVEAVCRTINLGPTVEEFSSFPVYADFGMNRFCLGLAERKGLKFGVSFSFLHFFCFKRSQLPQDAQTVVMARSTVDPPRVAVPVPTGNVHNAHTGIDSKRMRKLPISLYTGNL